MARAGSDADVMLREINPKSNTRLLRNALIAGMVLMSHGRSMAEGHRDPGDIDRLHGQRIRNLDGRAGRPGVAEGISAGSEPTFARVSIVSPTGTLLVSVDRGTRATSLTTIDLSREATIDVEKNWVGAQVTASRMGALVGRPIDIFHPIERGAANALSVKSLPFGMPVAARGVTSGFGYRVHPILGGIRLHSGVDLAAPYGTPVVATTEGRVGEAGWYGGYGLYVSLDHGAIETRYGHMSRLNVVAGQNVRSGDVIGYVGSTGRSTGPHLHYEVRVNGKAVNPLRTKR